MTESDTLWGVRPLPALDETVRVDAGPLTLRIRRLANEVRLASHRADQGPLPEEETLEESAWSRWALREGEEFTLRLSPALPDRMLVVKMEQPFTLMSRAEARVYAQVAAWVRVEALGPQGPLRLAEVPVERLSETWWGTFLKGEPAFWLPTRARRALTDDLFEPWMITCTLQLSNRSPDDLPVEKLALRVEHLSVFESRGRLWAEETVVAYLGEEEGSDILMDDRPPREAEEAREVTPARTQSKGFRIRTFERLRAWSPFSTGG